MVFEERILMKKAFKIPTIYLNMNNLGLLERYNYLWIDDMEWIPIDQISNYQYEEGEIDSLIPFAHTARYDNWVWIYNELNNNYAVGLCESSELYGVYYAQNTEDAIMRNIIEYLSSADFYRDSDSTLSYQKSENELKILINTWKDQLTGILCEQYIELINYFSNLKLKKYTHKQGEWDALLSYDERDNLIEKYIKFELINDEFPRFNI